MHKSMRISTPSYHILEQVAAQVAQIAEGKLLIAHGLGKVSRAVQKHQTTPAYHAVPMVWLHAAPAMLQPDL